MAKPEAQSAKAAEVVEEKAAEESGPKMSKRVEGITKEAVVTVKAETNPKRVGSAAHTRFEGYLTLKKGATVQEALDAGLTMGDIAYDIIHGSIEVVGAAAVEYAVKARGAAAEGADGASGGGTEDGGGFGDGDAAAA